VVKYVFRAVVQSVASSPVTLEKSGLHSLLKWFSVQKMLSKNSAGFALTVRNEPKRDVGSQLRVQSETQRHPL